MKSIKQVSKIAGFGALVLGVYAQSALATPDTTYLARCHNPNPSPQNSITADIYELKNESRWKTYVKFHYVGPNTAGLLDQAGSDVENTFELTDAEIDSAYLTGSKGERLFSFRRGHPNTGYSFTVTVDLEGEKRHGFIHHADGMPVNFSAVLVCH